MSFPELDRSRLPAAVREVAARLESAGFDAWWVGEGLARAARGEPTAREVAFEVATSASSAESLALFPNAVPTGPERDVVTVPTGGAPVDLLALRWGRRVEDDLAHRGFTVLALALRPGDGAWTDPHGGREDLATGRLRCVGDAVRRLHEDPVRVLRAARLVSEWGLEPDAAVEDAMRQVSPALTATSPVRRRSEMCRVLLGPHVTPALRLLRRTGVERRLVREVRDDAADLVGALPPRLELRLAAWLRDARSRALLKRLRFGSARSQYVERLLASHPLDERVAPTRDRAVLRLERQLAAADLEGLFQLRELELQRLEAHDPSRATDARKALAALRNGLERVRQNALREQSRTRLAIGGEEVMEWLGCEPGRAVGAALRHVAAIVAEDPSRNEREALRQALLAWHAGGGGRER